MGWLDDDTFVFFVPAQIIDIEKAEGKPDKRGDKGTKRWIQGVASTSSRDLQGEIVDQNGIDFNYFLKYGYLNNDHKPGFDNKVGQPTQARITKNGLWVKGFLFENHEVADSIWELMNALEATQADRRLGFSIQGKVKRREGNIIKECWIQDIAVTPAPVNTTTWAEIAKSLSAQKWDLSRDNDGVDKAADGGEHTLLLQNVPKHGAHSVLGVESLEGDEKEAKDTHVTSKSLTYDEAVCFLEVNYDLPRGAAENIAKAIFLTIPGE
jgi:hypothetical protein